MQQYLIDFQKKNLDNIFERNVALEPSKNFISSIIGARRVGKSYLLLSYIKKLERKKAMYIDFEMPEFQFVKSEDIFHLINIQTQLFGEVEYLFFDEIQTIPGWEKAIRKLYEQKKYYIFITGSSSKMLSAEIATQLRGRSVNYYLYPLSFQEILDQRGITVSQVPSTEKMNNILFEFREYLTYGGYPQVFLEKRFHSSFIKDYRDLIIFRDMIERYNIKNIQVIKRIFDYFIRSFGKTISTNAFYNNLKSQNIEISKRTLYEYFGYFEDTMFFHPLKSAKIKTFQTKIYLNDHSFLEENYGRKLENIVMLQLLYSGLNDIIFHSSGKAECNFIINNETGIQVTWELNNENTNREVNGLNEAAKVFNLKQFIILTWAQEYEIKNTPHPIQVIPVWKWLLKLSDFSL
jgi:uncharacterized protein